MDDSTQITQAIARLKEKFVIYFSIVGIIALYIFGITSFLVGKPVNGWFELLIGAAAIINGVVYYYTRQFKRASLVILILMYILLPFLFINGGISNTATFWFFVFPALAFFLRGKSEGIAWVSLFVVTILSLQTLGYFGAFQIQYTWGQLRQILASFLTVSALIYFYELISEQTLKKLSKKAKDLTKTNQEQKEQTLSIEKKQQSILKNVEELENTKRAVLNILEDLDLEKKEAEKLSKDLEKFELAVANANDQIVIADAEGLILYANPSVEKITGYAQEEVIGKKAGGKELWGGLQDKTFYKSLWKTIKEDKKTYIGKIKNKRKDGVEYHAQISISPIFDSDGKVASFVAIERDITKEQQIDQAKTEFVSLASHQLKTPLSAINWYTELLLSEDDGTLNAEQKQYVSEVATGSKRMVDLVNSLLNVSRLELGTFIVEPEPIQLLPMLRSVLDELKPTVDARSLKIKENHQDIPDTNVDPKLMRIIFQNLLSNAVKYTPEKGTISTNLQLIKKGQDLTKQKKAVEDTILFSVSDTGYGIPKDQQSKIFTKLFRADNVQEKDTDGTGLGLYMIKSILNHSGGEVWFESQKDQGSTFYVTIPAKGMTAKKGTKALHDKDTTLKEDQSTKKQTDIPKSETKKKSTSKSK